MALKSFLKFCRAVLEVNAIDPDSIRLPRRPRPQVQYLTNLEIGALRDSIDSSRLLGLRLRTLFEVLLTTGMRISEALQLDRDSIDPITNEATIIGKGNKPRTIFVNSECMAWIKKYVTERRDINPALFVTYGDHPKRLRRGDVPRFFMALAKSAGIDKHFTPHLLRHTFCTNLRNNGADISLIKELAGHQDIDTTARYYLSSDKGTLREAVHKYQNYSVATESSGAS